ncbi:MAG: hypothetical protein ACRDHO_00345, partial [Actinomycetota bacterium]
PSMWPGMTAEILATGNRAIEDAATAAGRDPTSIRRILNLSGSIEQSRGEGFVGPASFWVDELTRLVDAGMDAFMFWPAHDEEQQIEVFAEEVIAAVRDAAAAAPRNGRIAG